MKIGIISLGLIGGSLLKALSRYSDIIELTAVTRNASAIEEAKKYTPNVSNDIETIKNCDLIFVCSPMNKVLETLDKLESMLKPETIVTDVSSLKEFVMKKERPYKFIGSHPMAGTENSGFEASFPSLFEGAKWVITPFKNSAEKDIEQLEKIIKLTGAIPIKAEAQEHDKAAALISHMPMLVAQALMKTALKNPLAINLASSGFRDMTRLALSNTEMAKDMVLMNGANISESLVELTENIKSLTDENYFEQIEILKDFRKNMYDTDGKNISY